MRIRVTIFVMIRLCANTEIGVPREDLHFSGATSVRIVITALSAVPALPGMPHSLSFLPPPSVIPAPPRHSCEGRNLNQGMDVLT